MAKIKISELANQMEKKNIDIISALDALSIDNNGKRFVANSSIEEDVAEKVKKHLNTTKESGKVNIKTERKGEASKAETKTDTKEQDLKTEAKTDAKTGITKPEANAGIKAEAGRTEKTKSDTGKTEVKSASGKTESVREETKAEGGQ